MNTNNLIAQIGEDVQSFASGIKGPRSGIEIIRKLSDNSDKIIGLPPIAAYHSLFQAQRSGIPFNSTIDIKSQNDWHVLSSSTILKLIPAIPKFSGIGQASESGEIFSMDYNEGAKKYIALLKNADIEPRFVSQSTNRRASIDVAVLSNYSLSESFNSTYEESMIEGMANTASNVVNQVRPLAPEISSSVQKLTDSAGNLIKGAMSGLGMEAGGNAMANAMKTAGMVATGNKVDFPQIWASSSYSPSYKFTTLLYNPWPDDPSIGNEDYCYNKYIVEPLSHLMAFIMPISADGVSYTYPVLCGAYGGGLFNVNAGYIETFDINIGGANSDISFLQRPNIIEVDFTIRHLYSTMIGYVSDGISSKQISEERPSFKGFVSGLRSFAVIESKEYDLNDNIVNNVVNIANNVDRIVRRNINDNNTDILFDSDGRLNVSDEINSSDPALLNDEDIPPELQQNVQNYKRDMQLLIDSGVTITPQIQIALRLRNGLQSYVPDATIAQFLTNIDDYPDKVIINEIMKDVNIDGVYSNPQIATTSEGEL